MAKTTKNAVNKSEKIREYLAENPTASPKAIQKALAGKGIKISSGLASNVKYTSQKTKPAPKAAKPKRQQKKGEQVKYESLVTAKELAKAFGSTANAIKALEKLGDFTKAKKTLQTLECLQLS